MRRFLLLALFASVGIVGCGSVDDDPNALKVGAVSLFDPTAVNPSLCGSPAIPFPNNALFASATSPTGITTDTTLNIFNPTNASTVIAANLTDGFSTTASAFFDVVGLVDYASAADGIVILETDSDPLTPGAQPAVLQMGVDYTIQPSVALGQVSGTGGCALDPNVNTSPARFLPILQQRSRILIEPLHPLNPSTTYIVAVTRGLKSAGGAPVTPNEFFPIVNSDRAICDRTGSDADLIDCSDPAAPADAAARLNAPILNIMTAPTLNQATGLPVSGATAAAIRLTTLEALRASLVRPTVSGMNSLLNAIDEPAIEDKDLVIAWSFTTQAIGASLQTLMLAPGVTTAKTFGVIPAPAPPCGTPPCDANMNGSFSTGELGLGLPDVADIYAGFLLAVPYYLDDASGVNDTGPLTGYWHNNGTVTTGASGVWPAVVFDHDADADTAPIPAPCSGAPFNFVAPVSTTNCYRIPVAGGNNDAQGNPWGSNENLPVMITVPNANSGQTKPVNGWPVVIFQHGITGNRTQVLPLAPALAAQGFVVVSIDLPLHGLVPAGSTATCGSTSNNGFYQAGGLERTFDLDLVNNASGAAGPDMVTDCSGTHFINLASLITSRDNIRQAVVDQIHLIKSLQAANPMNLDGDTNTDDIDASRIHFAGISLGSIVGTTLLGVDTGASPTADGSDEAIIAASLSVPGGGLGKLLDASATFGPRIAAGLAQTAFTGPGSTGVGSPFEGTDTYETFVRFAQHLVDPGDPINYAVSANANHRIHMQMVENDTVVPNSATTTCPAPNTFPAGIGTVTGNPAADNSLAATRQAACVASGVLVGANQVTGAPTNACPGIATTGFCPAVTSAALGGAVVQDETLLTGYLSGTEPLYGEMGLTVEGPITAPAQANDQNCSGLDVLVHFATGTHASLLSPSPVPEVFTEMQRQVRAYLGSDGTSLVSATGCAP